MGTILEVTLLYYQSGYLNALSNFYLPADQEQFTALPVEMLETTDVRHPIVIVNQNEPVGFFVLHSSDRVAEYTDNPNALLLTALSINHAHQGKGFAQKGMKQLNDFVKQQFPQCNEIVLAVNQRNIPAQKLYEKAGFIDTGRRKIGKIGEHLILCLKL